MSQLVIEYDFEGGWRRKYYDLKYKKPVALSIPKHNYGKDIIIGVTVDRREEWRAKLNFITKNAEYEITVKAVKNENSSISSNARQRILC